jgi:AraC-like DNA-binding protein
MRAPSADDFASDPLGRYWLGATQLVWCRSATVCGSLHWDRPRARDVDELARALEIARHPALSGGFDMLTDARAVERLERGAYESLLALVHQHAREWSSRVVHHAVLVRHGPAAALLAGLAPLAGLAHKMCFVSDHAAALDWMGWTTRPDALAAAEQALHLASAARGLAPVVQRLRSWLEVGLIGATLEAAASALAMSARSLQRELCDAGTCFTSELQASRVRIACALLRDTDDKVDAIARAVGATSASQLSLLFRRQLGITPARYRARHANQPPALELEEVTIDTVEISIDTVELAM